MYEFTSPTYISHAPIVQPHLGLTSTLEKLYELAKSMADCVVPQEYGTTETEKRSVGVKICRSLLEKIRFEFGQLPGMGHALAVHDKRRQHFRVVVVKGVGIGKVETNHGRLS